MMFFRFRQSCFITRMIIMLVMLMVGLNNNIVRLNDFDGNTGGGEHGGGGDRTLSSVVNAYFVTPMVNSNSRRRICSSSNQEQLLHSSLPAIVGQHKSVSTTRRRAISNSDEETTTTTTTTLSSAGGDDDDLKRRISAASDDSIRLSDTDQVDDDETTAAASSVTSAAATNTVNARLMEELNQKMSSEKKGSGKMVEKMGGLFNGGRVRSDEERQLALEEARDLNGVNPLVCFGASATCFGLSYVLWEATSYITDYIATHPIDETKLYVVQRLMAVLRNVIIGMSSLGCGFSGVIGLGLLLLGGRTAYGVYITKELDPTPITNKGRTTMGGVDRGYDPNVAIEEFNPKDAFDLMMGKTKNKKRTSRK